MKNAFNSLSAGKFLIIFGHSITQGNMGREAPRYAPWGLES